MAIRSIHVQVHRAQLGISMQAIGTRYVRRLLQETAAAAYINASQGPYATGNLAAHTFTRGPYRTGLMNVSGVVGNDAEYAEIVERGAGVHPIFPRAARGVYRFGSRRRPQLRFFWRRAARVVYFPHIPGSPRTVGRSHPGLKGKRYMIRALEEVAHRHGHRVRHNPLAD